MTATITALSGAIAKLLTRECSDAAQLADLATVLRILREAIRNKQALKVIDDCESGIMYLSLSQGQKETEEYW